MAEDEKIMFEALRKIKSKSEMWQQATQATTATTAVPPWWNLGYIAAAAMLPKLREMGWKERMIVMQAAQELTLEDAVWLDIDESPDKRLKYQVPGWSDKPISGAQVLALMVFGLWVSVGENEEVAAGLLVDWPDIPAYVKMYEESE